MGVPKRKVSKSKSQKRRSVWYNITSPSLAECPQCHELKKTHQVCPACGYYKGKERLAVN